jgi:hypothetical protein
MIQVIKELLQQLFDRLSGLFPGGQTQQENDLRPCPAISCKGRGFLFIGNRHKS